MNGKKDKLHRKKDEGLTFALTIKGNMKDFGEMLSLFDFSKINFTPDDQPVEEDPLAFEEDHETVESLEESLAKTPDPEPEISMDDLKKAALDVSKRLGSKKPIGQAIQDNFGCMLPDLKPEQYRKALEILESLGNA